MNLLTHRWTIMSVWLTSGVAAFMMAITVGVLLPSISDELLLSPTLQGFLGSSAFVGNLVLALPLSWWTSQFRPKLLTTTTLIVGAILLAMQAWSPTFIVLLAGRLGFGITTLAREPARAILMHQWFSPREFIIVNGVYNALFGVVVGGGLATTPFILSAMGDNWRYVLYAFVALSIGMTVLWMALGRERPRPEPELRQESSRRLGLIKRVLSHRDLWIAGIGFTGATLGWSSFLNFYPTFMLDSFGVSLNWSGGILGLGILMGGFAGIVLSYGVMVLSAARRRNLIQALGILMTVTYLVMIRVDSIPLLLVVSAVNGIAWGFWPILSSVPFYLPGIRPREVAVAVSLVMTMATFGTFLGPSVTGILQDRLGDLRVALLIVSFAPLSLSLSGTLLSIRTNLAGSD